MLVSGYKLIEINRCDEIKKPFREYQETQLKANDKCLVFFDRHDGSYSNCVLPHITNYTKSVELEQKTLKESGCSLI